MPPQERRRPGRPSKDAEPVALVLMPAAELAVLTSDQRDAFEEAFQSVRSGLNSNESRRAYQREWGNYVAFLIKQRQQVVMKARTGDVQAYLEWLRDDQKLGRASRARALAVIRVVYGALVRFDAMRTNPAREAKNPKSTTDQKTPVLTEEELRQFIRVMPGDGAGFADRRNYLIAMTASFTGLRRSNLATIAIDTFRRHESGDWLVEVRVKGDKRKEARIIESLATALLAWCHEYGITAGAIFRSSPISSKSISLSTVRNALKDQGERAGIQRMDKISPHTFRRTFASMAKKRNSSISDIQRELMHSRISTTEGYLKYDDSPAGLGHSFEDLMPDRFKATRPIGARAKETKHNG